MKMTKEEARKKIIADYKAACKAASGRDVELKYEKGWYRYSSDGTKFSFRENDILRMTSELNYRAKVKAEQA